MRRPSRQLGAPQSQECHVPDLTTGNQECAGAPVRQCHCTSAPSSPACQLGIVGFVARFRYPGRALSCSQSGIPPSTPLAASRCPLPSIPRGAQSRLASLCSLHGSPNACQVLARPHSCDELSNSERRFPLSCADASTAPPPWVDLLNRSFLCIQSFHARPSWIELL
jgi:hypothetical protein